MRERLFLCLVVLITISFSACVSNKVHRAEVSSREQCEAREKVLVNHLLDRKKETADLTKQVGDLNRTIGNQEAEIRELKADIALRTQQMGESSSKMANEISALKKEVAVQKDVLTKQDITLQAVSNAQKSRQQVLQALKRTLLKDYPESAGTTLELTEQAAILTLPDAGLFDANGLSISATGKTLLTSLAKLLADRPELDVDVLAYTDNVLPKGAKNLADTWDWSLMRATNVVRLLIRDFNINANQLTPVGKGEFYPLSSNETPEGRQKNRRTVFVIYPALQKVPAVD